MPASPTQTTERVSTGDAGLDRVLGGGLFPGQVYVVSGAPGSGKTILASQMAYAAAARGRAVVHATLMAESHAQILWQLSGFDFYDKERAGREVRYLNVYTHLESGGLDSLRDALRGTVREANAALLILDGVVSAELLSRSEGEYKRFVQDLQSWCGMFGCTVLLLSSSGDGDAARPEHTMVDGILLLRTRVAGMRRMRELQITKLRGTRFLEGDHVYDISAAGLRVYPRIEALLRGDPRAAEASTTVPTGVQGLDAMLGGGVEVGSTSFVLGTSGAGKTLLGMQFLEAGARAGEPGLLFGFYEDASVLDRKATRLGLDWAKHVAEGRIEIVWQPPAEQQLDMLAHRLLQAIERVGARRLFLDGLVGFKEAAFDPERVGPFFAVLTNELRSRGVTTVVSDETRDLLVRDARSPTEGLSALCENILFLCQVESRGEVQRLLNVLKVRCSGHARRFHHLEIGRGGLRVVGPAPTDGTVQVTQAPGEP